MAHGDSKDPAKRCLSFSTTIGQEVESDIAIKFCSSHTTGGAVRLRYFYPPFCLWFVTSRPDAFLNLCLVFFDVFSGFFDSYTIASVRTFIGNDTIKGHRHFLTG